MKKLLLIIIIAAVYFGYVQHHAKAPEISTADTAQQISEVVTTDTTSEVATTDITQDDSALSRAFDNKISNIQVQGQGVISRVLTDDNDGSRHQRFIVQMRSGQTILIAHNIDLAPRISSLNENDSIEFNGVYEWNAKGGVVHWTHIDPSGHHQAGWLKHNGQTYQ